MYHQITVLGRLGQDPELRYTSSQKAVVNLSIAVTERWGDNETTVWYRATAWDKRAEVLAQYFRSGQLIFVTGRPKAASAWETSAGEVRASNEFTIDNFSFVEPKSESNGQGPSRPATTPATITEDVGDIFGEDEIPF